MDGVDHFVVVEALCGRQLHLPSRFKTRAHFGIVDRLVAGQEIRHGAVIAGALDVVVAAQRIGAGAGPHVIAGDQQQIGNRGGGIRTHAVLRDAHRPENADAIGLRDHVRDLFEQCRRAGRRSCAANSMRERLQALPVLLETVDPLARGIRCWPGRCPGCIG